MSPAKKTAFFEGKKKNGLNRINVKGGSTEVVDCPKKGAPRKNRPLNLQGGKAVSSIRGIGRKERKGKRRSV